VHEKNVCDSNKAVYIYIYIEREREREGERERERERERDSFLQVFWALGPRDLDHCLLAILYPLSN